MDSALEKLEVYEFFTVFLVGIISEALLCVTLNLCFHISLAVQENALLFVLVGYFIGLLLHELSVYLKKPFKKWFCTTFTDQKRFFTGADLEMAKRVKTHVLKKDETDTASDAYVASVCCNDLQVNKNIAGASGLQKESEFALSLSVAAILLAGIVGIAMAIHNVNQLEYEVCIAWVAIALSLALSVLFFFRSKRMHKYYIRSLIRTYAVTHKLTGTCSDNTEDNQERSEA